MEPELNPDTGNIRDDVSEAWREYRDGGGTLESAAWHSRHAPPHSHCNLCQ